MLDVFATRWGLVLTRAALALVAGVLLLTWRDPTPEIFLRVLGLYAAADGLVAAMLAFGLRSPGEAGGLLADAAIRGGGGIVAAVAPTLVTPAMTTSIGIWAGLSGLAQMAVAVVLRRELTGHWPMPIAALLSLALAALTLGGWAADFPRLVWTVAGYCILTFAVQTVFAYRMWQLACEMGRA